MTAEGPIRGRCGASSCEYLGFSAILGPAACSEDGLRRGVQHCNAGLGRAQEFLMQPHQWAACDGDLRSLLFPGCLPDRFTLSAL